MLNQIIYYSMGIGKVELHIALIMVIYHKRHAERTIGTIIKMEPLPCLTYEKKF